MKQLGFTLIELLIAMAISSMIALALFNGFGQTNRAVQQVDEVVSFSTRAITASHQLRRDLSGAFVPVEGQRKKNEEQKKEAEQKEMKQKEEKGKPKKRINRVFYGTVANEMLDTLTFVSNNPAFDPICVNRVVYRLVPEKGPKNAPESFALMRQEGTELDFAAYAGEGEKVPRAYEVMGGIKKLTVVYTAAMVKEKVERKGNQETKTIETEYKVFNDWNVEEEMKQAPKGDQLRRIIIPYAVDINFTLWDARKRREKSYTVKVIILPEAQEFEPELKQQGAKTPMQQPKPQTATTQQFGLQRNIPLTQAKKPQKPAKPKSAFDQIPSVINTLLGVGGSKGAAA